MKKKAVSLEGFIFGILMVGAIAGAASIIGGVRLANTVFQTAHRLITEVCFYIMGMSVLTGALSALLSEFGVLAILNRLVAPLMKPIYDLPGAASLAIISTFLSDNPAILPLCEDQNFKRYFKRYQMPALTNLGTAFGMGMMVILYVVGIPAQNQDNMSRAALVGLLGAVIGSIVSTRLMLTFTARAYGKTENWEADTGVETFNPTTERLVRPGGVGRRFLAAMMEGGENGLKTGVSIIPGVVIICTVVAILTNSPTDPTTPGVGLLPWIGDKLSFILQPLFGFSSPKAIAIPITALGSAGASLALLPQLYGEHAISVNDLAVSTAMCMCWSGYLSTHVAMMESLKSRELTGKAILSHTIGGLVAGLSAHWIFVALSAWMG